MVQTFRNSLFQQLVLILIIVGLLCLLGNWWGSYSLQVDEGLNLEKAALVDNGYRLYNDIWSDQPPLLTYALAFVHHAFPFSVAAARVTILIFSILLATSLFRVVLRFEGSLAAWSSVLFLISSELFLKLSVSVMIGLPAVALAMLAVDLATIGKGKGPCPSVVCRRAIRRCTADETVCHDRPARHPGGFLVHAETGGAALIARIGFSCYLVLRRDGNRRRHHSGGNLGLSVRPVACAAYVRQERCGLQRRGRP